MANKVVASVKANPVKSSGAVIAMIAAVLAVEGGYVNDPRDPGGETNMGITKKVAVQHGYTGPMRTLPKEVATSIYYDSYIVAPGYEPLIPLDAAVTEELFDTTVNMGQARPSRFFQQSINESCFAPAAGMKVDGRVGKSTISAFQVCQSQIGATRFCLRMLDSMDAKQRAEYDRLVRVNPSLSRFYKGWIRLRIGNVDRKRCGRTSP